jgi:hypothetical protein
VTFDQPLVILSKGEVGKESALGGVMAVTEGAVVNHEAYLASGEKLRRDRFRSGLITTLLWHKTYKMRMLIPEIHLFCNGRYLARMFSSKKHANEITKVPLPAFLVFHNVQAHTV